MKTFHLQIIGKVQGVFYRASTKEKARELELRGWVRNKEDESVELMVSGDERQLSRFIDWCWVGPPRARVDNIHLKELPFQDFPGFEIRR